MKIMLEKISQKRISPSDVVAFAEAKRAEWHQAGNIDVEDSALNSVLKLLLQDKKITPEKAMKMIYDMDHSRQQR